MTFCQSIPGVASHSAPRASRRRRHGQTRQGEASIRYDVVRRARAARDARAAREMRASCAAAAAAANRIDAASTRARTDGGIPCVISRPPPPTASFPRGRVQFPEPTLLLRQIRPAWHLSTYPPHVTYPPMAKKSKNAAAAAGGGGDAHRGAFQVGEKVGVAKFAELSPPFAQMMPRCRPVSEMQHTLLRVARSK